MDLWQYLSVTPKPIFLYGTGNGADKILNELYRRGIPVKGVFASDGFVRNRTFRGFKVCSFREVKDTYGDIIVLVCFGTQLPDVMENIKKIALACETYAPDVPVADEASVFDSEYARLNREKIEKAYSLLEDEFSKKVFENTVMYKLTGKLNYLFDIETEKTETYKLLDIGASEIYLDIGAYNGDTVAEFLQYTKQYEKIIAVEPDSKNFKKLQNNTRDIKNIALINAAVTDKSGKIMFAQKGGRNSVQNAEGTQTDAVTVDDILCGQAVTFIKMDIEGLEIPAINGAVNTLKQYKPKLNIAAYHKNGDLFEIPLLLNEINPDYKIYLRHHPYIPSWDTNFYVL